MPWAGCTGADGRQGGSQYRKETGDGQEEESEADGKKKNRQQHPGGRHRAGRPARAVRRRLPDRAAARRRAAPAQASAAERGDRPRRAVGGQHQRLPHGIPRRQAVPRLLSRLALRPVRQPLPAGRMLRRKPRRHRVVPAGAGPSQLPGLDAQQHRLGRHRRAQLRALPRPQPGLPGGGRVQSLGERAGAHHRGAGPLRLQVGRRRTLEPAVGEAGDHRGCLRLAEPRLSTTRCAAATSTITATPSTPTACACATS